MWSPSIGNLGPDGGPKFHDRSWAFQADDRTAAGATGVGHHAGGRHTCLHK